MADAVDPTDPPTEDTTTAIAEESPASDAGNEAQDPSEAVASELSSMTVTNNDDDDDGAKNINNASSNSSPAPEPQAAQPAVAPPAPAQQQAAQQLPLILPANIANLADAEAAEALDNEFLSLLPPCILPRINKLKTLNEQRDAILEEYRLERAKLELKFSQLIQPLYEERRGVVSGEMDGVIDDEAAAAGGGVIAEEEGVVEDVVDEDDEDDENGQQQQQLQRFGAADGDVKGIPQFWACAMGHVDVIAELITEADVDCLDHLTDITSTDLPDGLGFELTFHFSPNSFFTNTTLTKKYEVPNLLTEDEPILQNVTGTTIHWKQNQSLTYKEVTKKQRKKGGPNAGQIRTTIKKERTESFFHFFTPPKMPGLMEVMDEDDADAVEEEFDHDYDVAQAIRGHLIPKAVLWFTGEAMMMDDLDEDMMEEMMMGNNGGGGSQPQQFTFNPDGGDNPFPPPAPHSVLGASVRAYKALA